MPRLKLLFRSAAIARLKIDWTTLCSLEDTGKLELVRYPIVMRCSPWPADSITEDDFLWHYNRWTLSIESIEAYESYSKALREQSG